MSVILNENEISKIIINCAIDIHKQSGPGLLESVEKSAKVYSKQLLTYLRLTNKKLGLLLNFGETLLKDGIERVVNGL